MQFFSHAAVKAVSAVAVAGALVAGGVAIARSRSRDGAEPAVHGPAVPRTPAEAPTGPASGTDAARGAEEAAPGGRPAGFVAVDGARFVLDGETYRPFGFNHTFGDDLGTADYFHEPTDAGLAVIREEFQHAARLGADSLRVFLELHDFVERAPGGEIRVRPDRLEAYRKVLEEAEAAGLKLDVTGNLAWTPAKRPQWYDEMSNEDRWQVQATFWREVARAGADSPAVFCYELTSEPTVKADPSAPWYVGRLGNQDFVQVIARGVQGQAATDAVRGWARTLTGAIREVDPHHLISVGLMPFATGPASAETLAPELDFLILHDYPKGRVTDPPNVIDRNVETARRFASHGKPVLLGETFALQADVPTQERYLRTIAPMIDGAYSFFNGAGPDMPVNDIVGAIYRDNIRSFIGMKDELTREP